MNHTSTYSRFFGIALVFCFLSTLINSFGAEDEKCAWDEIIIKAPRGSKVPKEWISLDDYRTAAVDHIAKRKDLPKVEGRAFLSINPDSSKEFVQVSFSGQFGQPMINVFLNRKCEVTKIDSGIMMEGNPGQKIPKKK